LEQKKTVDRVIVQKKKEKKSKHWVDKDIVEEALISMLSRAAMA
jgi:hypothetical protein